jgi:hypothetical protein
MKCEWPRCVEGFLSASEAESLRKVTAAELHLGLWKGAKRNVRTPSEGGT